MKKILFRHYENRSKVYEWFCNMYGWPQDVDGFEHEPTQIKKGYQWAYGNTDLIDPQTYQPMRAIWCSDEMFTMYVLRWK